jgi:hypothetical protein
MKQILFTMFFLATALISAQNGTINGKITDAEEGNSPLLFAKVTIKETGTKVITDANGTFKFKNINEGAYTLICSFTGYETKEIKVEVNSKTPNNITLALGASSLSLDDLAMVYASSEQKDNTIKNN